MSTWVITFAAMLLFITAMAVGVMAGRKPLKGSCGGMQNLGLKGNCDICGGDLEKCDEAESMTAKIEDDEGVQQFRPGA